MSKKSGIYVEYTTKKGTTQKGIVVYKDQKPEFSNYLKVFIRLCDEKFKPIKNEAGKALISIKHQTEVKVIGFID